MTKTPSSAHPQSSQAEGEAAHSPSVVHVDGDEHEGDEACCRDCTSNTCRKVLKALELGGTD